MKLKQCGYKDHKLPVAEFSSTSAKYCNSCKKIRAIEMDRARKQKQIDKLKNKVKTVRKTKKKKRLSDLKKTTQTVVNKFIRQRDYELSCISCNKPHTQAGHFIAQGTSGYLRYHPDNIHGQDTTCNHFKSGNLIEYRINLIQKIGVKKVEWLENSRNKIHKYTREQLKQIRDACSLGDYTSKTWNEIMSA